LTFSTLSTATAPKLVGMSWLTPNGPLRTGTVGSAAPRSMRPMPIFTPPAASATTLSTSAISGRRFTVGRPAGARRTSI
jgi:hypothetical protein